MHLLQAILMGIVQGLSEFLPISSSAHLVFTSNFYKIFKHIEVTQITEQEIFFDIMLHFGTLIAVLIFFRKELLNILKAFWFGLIKKEYKNYDFKIGCYIILGTVLTAIVAIPLCKISEALVFMPAHVGLILIVTGFVLLFSEKISKKYTERKNITLKTSVLTGLAQGLASLPGFSRSGLTIAAGLLFGCDRITAAKYSFLLSIPVILGASMIYPFVKINPVHFTDFNWSAIATGTVVSGIVGYFCIKYFLKFLERFSMAFFGYYCILAGTFAYLFFKGGI
jgi:undecaprenyl-diphosphatase